MKEHSPSDSILLSQLAAGDQAAFTKLYFRFGASIYNALMMYIKDEHEADDLLQNVFIRLWERREKLASIQSIEDYLFIMARNMVLNRLRRKALEDKAKRVLKTRLPESADATGSKVLETEYRKILQEAIDALPDRQRQVYLLATEEHMSFDDIAAGMGVSKFTVKKHLELARKSVRAYLGTRLQGCTAFPFLLATGLLLHTS